MIVYDQTNVIKQIFVTTGYNNRRKNLNILYAVNSVLREIGLQPVSSSHQTETLQFVLRRFS